MKRPTDMWVDRQETKYWQLVAGTLATLLLAFFGHCLALPILVQLVVPLSAICLALPFRRLPTKWWHGRKFAPFPHGSR